MGNSAAQATANRVIASANRLIDVRHCWCNSNSTAEINVPACPMPTHQTKFTIANPHATGMFTPQMPIPTTNRYPTAYSNNMNNANDIANPAYQPRGVGRVNTMELILSVTCAYV